MFLDEDDLVSIEDASADPGAENPVGAELFIMQTLCQCNSLSTTSASLADKGFFVGARRYRKALDALLRLCWYRRALL